MNLHAKQISIQIHDKTICKDLTLDIKSGESWGLLGPNGCGKTTLLHTLAGLHSLTAGEIFLGETKFHQFSTKAIAQSLGILLQEFVANFPQTVWDYCVAARYPHLAYFKKESDKDKQIVYEALATLELKNCFNRNILQLSGGEKKRLAIAALLAQTPSIYLLDEPTNHLDLRHQINILTHFRQLAATESATLLMSLHDINIAQRFCDHILLLFPNGRIEQGTREEMLTAKYLTDLYQHPIQSISDRESIFWYPKAESHAAICME